MALPPFTALISRYRQSLESAGPLFNSNLNIYGECDSALQ